MAKDTVMSKFGVAYDINAINRLAMSGGVKPLTPTQIKSMSKSELKAYTDGIKNQLRENRKNIRRTSRTMRRNAKEATSENFKQAKLMHQTIRQGLAELGGAASQLMAQSFAAKSATNAITQNTNGGTQAIPGNDEEQGTGNPTTEKGPVYSLRRRKEE